MTGKHMKKASLAEIRRMNETGQIAHDTLAPESDELGADFWAGAVVEEPRRPRSVHLKLDAEVFEFFRNESGGKGHITRMQNVLRAYAKARQETSER